MTETEWLTSTHPFTLMTAVRVVVTSRKMQLFGKDVEIQDSIRTPLISLTRRKVRLFGIACCRRASARLPPVILDLLLDVERQVDNSGITGELSFLGKATQEWAALRAADVDNYRPGVVTAAEAALWTADPDIDPVQYSVNLCNNLACSAAEIARKEDQEERWTPEAEAASNAEEAAQCAIFRDLFGNPFRTPPAIVPSGLRWNDGTLKRLAEDAYENRLMPGGTLDPARLGVLADALLDAGCTDPDILGHLRGPGPHWRGCHVVDLLTDRE